MFPLITVVGVGVAGQQLSCPQARQSIQVIAASGLEVRRTESCKGRCCHQRCDGFATQDSCWDTKQLQKRGVIWRGSSGRMLMESSARPQSRHSMVYSCGGTGHRGGAVTAVPQPGKPELKPAPDPLDCNQSWGGILFPPTQLP